MLTLQYKHVREKQRAEYFIRPWRSHAWIYVLSYMLQTFCVWDLVQPFKLHLCFPSPFSPSASAPAPLPVFSPSSSSLLRQLRFWSSDFEAFSSAPAVQRSTFLTPFLIFILFLLAVAWMQLFAMTPSHHSWPPFISLCVPLPLVSPPCAASGSLSSWIRAGCPSRRRRRKDSARCLWWVVNVTLALTGLDWERAEVGWSWMKSCSVTLKTKS